MDTQWMTVGNCQETSPSVFFPEQAAGVHIARKICKDCPVKAACLEYALSNRIVYGVWGGASERERRRLARSRRQDSASAPGMGVDHSSESSQRHGCPTDEVLRSEVGA